ncbi:MAG: hypothetical protein ACI89Z_000883 [Porticoccus sp.]|jgi:hypothetical protein
MSYQGGSKGFSRLLTEWEKRSADNADLITSELSIHGPDGIKLQALSELYQLPTNEIAGHLLHYALEALEAEMPYVPGTTVIRVEDGDEVYEDVGPLPRYLNTQKRLRK